MYVALAIVVLVFIVLMKTAIVVPQQSAFVVETLAQSTGPGTLPIDRSGGVNRHLPISR
jgi:hypothetical protein